MTPVIREIATGLKFPEGPIALPDGDVLLVEIARGTLSRVKPDGRVEVVAHTGGGPNGAAIPWSLVALWPGRKDDPTRTASFVAAARPSSSARWRASKRRPTWRRPTPLSCRS